MHISVYKKFSRVLTRKVRKINIAFLKEKYGNMKINFLVRTHLYLVNKLECNFSFLKKSYIPF